MSRFRHEYKYLINDFQSELLKIRIKSILFKDPHSDNTNHYLIRSLYLDDINDSCLGENLSGSDNRSKYRIRYYNNDTGRIMLEKKSKIRGMCLKESCSVSKEEIEGFINGKPLLAKDDDPEIKKRLVSEVMFKGLKPAVIVTYNREPYIYPGGNVRITFDEDITSSNEFNRFLSGDYSFRPVLPLKQSILEVKWDEALPNYIKETMALENYVWIAFSKYYVCRLLHA